MRPKPPVPLWRWALWWVVLAVALVLFYGLMTPLWMSLRAVAWVVGLPARRRAAYREAVTSSR